MTSYCAGRRIVAEGECGVRALVLAGGSGTRLLPWTLNLPKPLVPVANRPVLSWVLDHLDTAEEIDQVGVIVRPSQVDLYTAIVGHHTRAGRPIRWLTEAEPLGTGGALRHQRQFVADEPVLVVPADIICPVDLNGVIDYHRVCRPTATVAVTPRDLRVWGGDVVVVDDARRAVDYLFKPGRDAASNLGSTGTWVVEPALLDRMPEGFVDFSSTVLPVLARPLGVFHTGEVYLRDIGTPESLLTGNQEAVTGLAPLPVPPTVDGAVVEPGSEISGAVLLGQGARVCAGARVCGPTVVGPDAVISPGAHVETSVVLPGAVVRGQVTASIVGDAARAVQVLLAAVPAGRRP